MTEANVADGLGAKFLFDSTQDAGLFHHERVMNGGLQNANDQHAALNGVWSRVRGQEVAHDASPRGGHVFEHKAILNAALLSHRTHEVGDFTHGSIHDWAIGHATPVRDHPMPQLLQRCGRWDVRFLDHDMTVGLKVAPA